MTTYDVIIIGGGHNGLTAATFLAKRGKKTLVLEGRSITGGLAAPREFHPGYRTAGILHDTGIVRPAVVERLGLQQHGLKLENRRAPVMILGDDGRSVVLSDDGASAESIARVSREDGEAYRAYRLFIAKISPLILGLLDQPPPDLRVSGFGDLRKVLNAGMGLRRLGKETMYEVLKVMPMSVADFLNERFRTDFIKAGIGVPGIFGSFNGPWSSYAAMNLLLWEVTARVHVKGGPADLTHALLSAAKAVGVEVRTGAGVEQVLLNGSGEAEGVRTTGGETYRSRSVASSIHPKHLFLDLLKPVEIGTSLETEIMHYRTRGTVACMNLALNRRIRWKSNPGGEVAFVRTGNSFDQMEQAFDAVKYREFSKVPTLDVHVATVSNPALAPSGHEVVSVLSHFAPYEPDGGWTERKKKELSERIVAVVARHTVDLEPSIVASELLTPADLEHEYGLTGGNLFHGEQAVDQLIGRPVPSCASYRTPIPGLYLCGSGSHPGGGITGGPGMLAAQVIARELG